MKKLLVLLSACMLLIPGLAAAEEFEGNVVAAQSRIVTSPYGGVVQSVAVREGQTVQAGEAIAKMQTTKVYAAQAGVIRGIFAQAGDNVTDTAVLYIAPENQYEISCDTTYAYDSQESQYVRLGETVYAVYLPNHSYHSVGVVTAVDGSNYTVETLNGSLTLNTMVYVYRDEGYSNSQRLGRGTVNRMDELPVYGDGSLMKVYVENGEEVARGQLLFETVAGDMLISADSDGVIRADAAGIVESISIAAGDSIEQNAVVMTVVQPQAFEIEFLIGEDLLNAVTVGQQASVTFNWNEDTGGTVPGTVTRISYINEETDDSDTTGSGAQYRGYISFLADDTVKLGMSVTIETQD